MKILLLLLIPVALATSMPAIVSKGAEVHAVLASQARTSPCFRMALEGLSDSCDAVMADPEERQVLALRLTNCFLSFHGMATIDCPALSRVPRDRVALRACTSSLIESTTRGKVYTDYWHSTDTLCAFIRADVWAQATNELIEGLRLSAELSRNKLIELATSVARTSMEITAQSEDHKALRNESKSIQTGLRAVAEAHAEHDRRLRVIGMELRNVTDAALQQVDALREGQDALAQAQSESLRDLSVLVGQQTDELSSSLSSVQNISQSILASSTAAQERLAVLEAASQTETELLRAAQTERKLLQASSDTIMGAITSLGQVVNEVAARTAKIDRTTRSALTAAERTVEELSRARKEVSTLAKEQAEAASKTLQSFNELGEAAARLQKGHATIIEGQTKLLEGVGRVSQMVRGGFTTTSALRFYGLSVAGFVVVSVLVAPAMRAYNGALLVVASAACAIEMGLTALLSVEGLVRTLRCGFGVVMTVLILGDLAGVPILAAFISAFSPGRRQQLVTAAYTTYLEGRPEHVSDATSPIDLTVPLPPSAQRSLAVTDAAGSMSLSGKEVVKDIEK